MSNETNWQSAFSDDSLDDLADKAEKAKEKFDKIKAERDKANADSAEAPASEADTTEEHEVADPTDTAELPSETVTPAVSKAPPVEAAAPSPPPVPSTPSASAEAASPAASSERDDDEEGAGFPVRKVVGALTAIVPILIAAFIFLGGDASICSDLEDRVAESPVGDLGEVCPDELALVDTPEDDETDAREEDVANVVDGDSQDAEGAEDDTEAEDVTNVEQGEATETDAGQDAASDNTAAEDEVTEAEEVDTEPEDPQEVEGGEDAVAGDSVVEDPDPVNDTASTCSDAQLPRDASVRVVGIAADDPDGGLNFRQEPNPSSPIVGTFDNDVEFALTGGCEVVASGTAWWEATGQGITGWANSNFLEGL